MMEIKKKMNPVSFIVCIRDDLKYKTTTLYCAEQFDESGVPLCLSHVSTSRFCFSVGATKASYRSRDAKMRWKGLD